jgi:S1-C subfamily serine protease
MVPTPVIRHFLTDVADGRYAGIPRLGVRSQPMENPDLRRRYRVPDGTTGVLVLGTLPGFPAAEHLRAGDVLVSIDGHAIANDGTVEFRPRERTSLTFYIDARQIGDPITVGFLREGQAASATIPLSRTTAEGDLVAGPHYDTRPAYFLFGGLVFAPVTTDYVSMWGNGYPQLSALHDEPPAFDGQEIVVLSRVLAAEANEGYHELVNLIVTAVDGKKPANLAELVRVVEEGQSPFVTFAASDGREVVLDRVRARAAGPAIMQRYLIQADRFLPGQASPPQP